MSAAPAVDGLADMIGLVGSRRSERAALAPLIEKAEAAAATYETAKAGDHVLWCVTRTSEGGGNVFGRPVVFAGAPDLFSVPLSRRCTEILAVVEARRPEGVALRFVGLP